MLIELTPRIEALLKAQVTAGHFASIEEAVDAAVLGVPIADEALGDLSWARDALADADAAIADGRTFSEEQTFFDLEQRFGKL